MIASAMLATLRHARVAGCSGRTADLPAERVRKNPFVLSLSPKGTSCGASKDERIFPAARVANRFNDVIFIIPIRQ